jgi:sugar lactone lactonase YvrE
VQAQAIQIAGRVGCAMPRSDGGFLLGCEAGFAAVERDGTYALMAPIEVDAPASFINDGRCDALGRFWAGSVGIADDGNAAPGAGALHRLAGDGSVTTALRGLSLANGMDWSPEGRTLYLIDSLSGAIDAYDFDLAAGARGRGRRAVELRLPPRQGFADGMCVDAEGCLWTAVWGTGEVRRYTPAGVLERTLAMPVSQPTSCAFAGAELDVLVITSAWHRMTAAQRAAEPHAGSIFATRPGVRGIAVHAFASGT